MRKKLTDKITLLAGDSRSPAAEAYRTLRTNLQYAGIDRPIKKLMIAGPTEGCGKTTTLINLGIALSKTGSSVLLVDTDLRKPDLRNLFNVRIELGLTNYLIDRSVSREMIVSETSFKDVFVLSSGPVPPNPSEMISTDKFKELIEALLPSFDYLLFDTPPVNIVTDAAILSQLVDATLFVIRYGQVTKEAAAFALEQLKKVNANIIGAVLNAMPMGNGVYYYYSYGYGAKHSNL